MLDPNEHPEPDPDAAGNEPAQQPDELSNEQSSEEPVEEPEVRPEDLLVVRPGGIPVTLLEQLGDRFQVVEDSERSKGTAAAVQVVAIEDARRFQEQIQKASKAELAATGSVRFMSDELCWRSFTTEIGLAMNVPDRTAQLLIDDAYELTTFLPATLDALRAGRISYRHAAAIVTHTAGLDPASKLLFEEAALPTACEQPVSKFTAFARKLRERLNPIALEERHRTAYQKREFAVDPKQDGMAEISLYISAVDGIAIQDRIYAIADMLHRQPGEERTVTQLRADVATHILQDGDIYPPTVSTSTETEANTATDAEPESEPETAPAATPQPESPQPGVGRYASIRPTVMVTVPALAMLEKVNGEEPGDHGPAELDGYGPIPMDQAMELAGSATSFIRLLTHPETGTVLSIGRDRYKPPPDLARWIRFRYQGCRGPNSNRRAKDCDIDHNVAWQHGGDTAYDNLATLSRSIHTTKHSLLTDGSTGPDGKPTNRGEGWKISHERDNQGRSTGTLIWTTPTGRKYVSRPAVKIQPPPVKKPPPEPFDWVPDFDTNSNPF